MFFTLNNKCLCDQNIYLFVELLVTNELYFSIIRLKLHNTACLHFVYK